MKRLAQGSPTVKVETGARSGESGRKGFLASESEARRKCSSERQLGPRTPHYADKEAQHFALIVRGLAILVVQRSFCDGHWLPLGLCL